MVKGVSIITIVCLCLMFGIGIKSYAQPRINTEDVKEHIRVHLEKVKIKNPLKYQDMMKRVNGNVTQCTDCHKEVIEGNLSPAKKRMERIQPLKK